MKQNDKTFRQYSHLSTYVDNLVHIIPSDLYAFLYFMHKLSTCYPLATVDIGTVVLSLFF